MTEAERHVSFDGQALGKALGTRPATVHDVAYGEGQLFSAGHGAARLEVFPQTGVTRLTAADLRVELFGTADASVSETGVEFHRNQPDQQASLTVIPGGGVVFTFIAGAERTSPTGPPSAEEPDRSGQSSRLPDRLPQPPAEPAPKPAGATHRGGTSHPADGQGRALPDPTTARQPGRRQRCAKTPPRPAQSDASDAAPEQAPRVQLTGRLGRDPSFRTTTKTGTLVGRFPLAEHHDDGTTRWHTVLAFGDRAKQLERRTQAGELAQGREVEVIGYLHTNTCPGKDSRPRSVQEVYATAVTRH